MITEDNKSSLLYRIRNEGFDYTFEGYSKWEEVKDDEFHGLRELYLTTKEALYQYIKKSTSES